MNTSSMPIRVHATSIDRGRPCLWQAHCTRTGYHGPLAGLPLAADLVVVTHGRRGSCHGPLAGLPLAGDKSDVKHACALLYAPYLVSYILYIVWHSLVKHIYTPSSGPGKLEARLTAKELRSLRPRERGRYVQNLILATLDEAKPYTLSDIVEKSGLARQTVSKHLDALASTQQVKRAEHRLGRMSVSLYTRAGRISRREELRRTDGAARHSFFTLEGADGEQSVCIQQKGEDEYGSPVVKGAITVQFDDLQEFVRELHAYGARVAEK